MIDRRSGTCPRAKAQTKGDAKDVICAASLCAWMRSSDHFDGMYRPKKNIYI